jgi:hypothetical protein
MIHTSFTNKKVYGKICTIKFIILFSLFYLVGLSLIYSCTSGGYKKYPLSFGYKYCDVCNRNGDVVTKYTYDHDNNILYKKAQGLLEGEWIIQYGKYKNKNKYYEIFEIPQNQTNRNNGALVKYNKNGYIEEKIPNMQGESMGLYQYRYDTNGLLIEAFYYPKVALDEEKIKIRSIIEYTENQLVIKYIDVDHNIGYIEKYYN